MHGRNVGKLLAHGLGRNTEARVRDPEVPARLLEHVRAQRCVRCVRRGKHGARILVQNDAELPRHVARRNRSKRDTEVRERLEGDDVLRRAIRVVKTLQRKVAAPMLCADDRVEKRLRQRWEHVLDPEIAARILVDNASRDLLALRGRRETDEMVRCRDRCDVE